MDLYISVMAVHVSYICMSITLQSFKGTSSLLQSVINLLRRILIHELSIAGLLKAQSVEQFNR